MNKEQVRETLLSMPVGATIEVTVDDSKTGKFLRDFTTNISRRSSSPAFYKLSARGTVFTVSRVDSFFPYLKTMKVGDACIRPASEQRKIQLSIAYYSQHGMTFATSRDSEGNIIIKRVNNSATPSPQSKIEVNAIPPEQAVINKLASIEVGDSVFIKYKPLLKSQVRSIVDKYFLDNVFSYRVRRETQANETGVRVWKLKKSNSDHEAAKAEVDAVKALSPGEVMLIDCPTKKFYTTLRLLLSGEIARGLSVFVADHSFGKRTGLRVLRTVEEGSKIQHNEYDGYIIEDNVPVVLHNKSTKDKYSVVNVLDVNQSFFAPASFSENKVEYNRLHYEINKVKKKTGKKFVTNCRVEKGIKGVRVWRIE